MSHLLDEKLNLVQTFLRRVQKHASGPALYFKNPTHPEYLPISWADWASQVKKVTLGLNHLGFKRHDRIALLAENMPEWTFADLGILGLGAVVVPIYPTSSVQDIAYILENCGAQAIFISTSVQALRIRELLEHSKIRCGILLKGAKPFVEKLLTLDELIAPGEKEESSGIYQNLVNQVLPDDAATFIYTSGTTGPPKGVVLTHRNFISNCLGAESRITVTEDDTALSFLPLSHVFERMAGYYFMTFHGAAIAYAENMNTVPEDMQIVKPTVAAAVPRFYEKFYARVLEKVQAGTPLKKKIFYWALALGKERLANSRKKKQSWFLNIQLAIAQRLVFNPIRMRLGGRLKFFISGGAPLSKELGEFFYSLGIQILEGYGLTETSPVIAVNSLEDFRFGTVGKVLPNVELKIAGDGEILVRGPSIMKGYYKNEAATAESLQGGWFHTGDIGEIDPDGFLKITDRKKDIIATSGGKKISPQNIEGVVLSDSLFSQIVILGDKRNYLIALVVLNRSQVEEYARFQNLKASSYEDLIANPEIYRWAESRLREKTQNLASFEQIKYFAILKRELSQEEGELTPTLKVKRKVVMEKYKDVIDKLYQPSAEGAALQGH